MLKVDEVGTGVNADDGVPKVWRNNATHTCTNVRPIDPENYTMFVPARALVELRRQINGFPNLDVMREAMIGAADEAVKLKEKLAMQTLILQGKENTCRKVEQQAITAEDRLAASDERVKVLEHALRYMVEDLKMRSNLKPRKEDRGVVDVGQGVWIKALEALEKVKKGRLV